MSNEEFELADALHSAAIRLLRAVRHVDRSTGLSPARLSALSVLVFAGPLTVGRLAAAEGVRSPTMSGIVNGLVADGLAERRAGPGDQRSVEVHATTKGESLFNRAREQRVLAVARLLDGQTGPDLDRLRGAVRLLEQLLERAG